MFGEYGTLLPYRAFLICFIYLFLIFSFTSCIMENKVGSLLDWKCTCTVWALQSLGSITQTKARKRRASWWLLLFVLFVRLIEFPHLFLSLSANEVNDYICSSGCIPRLTTKPGNPSSCGKILTLAIFLPRPERMSVRRSYYDCHENKGSWNPILYVKDIGKVRNWLVANRDLFLLFLRR